jgi:hypothetical protein
MARETLKNRYFCKTSETTREDGEKEFHDERIEFENPDFERPKGVTHEQKSPAMELFVATDKAYNIQDADTIEKVTGEFSKANDSWFKFVLLPVRGEPKLYIIYGNDDQNKHSVVFYMVYMRTYREQHHRDLCHQRL